MKREIVIKVFKKFVYFDFDKYAFQDKTLYEITNIYSEMYEVPSLVEFLHKKEVLIFHTVLIYRLN